MFQLNSAGIRRRFAHTIHFAGFDPGGTRRIGQESGKITKRRPPGGHYASRARFIRASIVFLSGGLSNLTIIAPNTPNGNAHTRARTLVYEYIYIYIYIWLRVCRGFLGPWSPMPPPPPPPLRKFMTCVPCRIVDDDRKAPQPS